MTKPIDFSVLADLTFSAEFEYGHLVGYAVCRDGQLIASTDYRDVAEAISQAAKLLDATKDIKDRVHAVADQIWQGLLNQHQAANLLYEIAGTGRVN
jgi:hypothetical protein